MTENKRAEALRRLSDSLQAVLEDPAQLAALSQMLHYEQGQLRNDAGELSGTVEALESGSLYEFDELDLEGFGEYDFSGVSELELLDVDDVEFLDVDDLPQFEI